MNFFVLIIPVAYFLCGLAIFEYVEVFVNFKSPKIQLLACVSIVSLWPLVLIAALFFEFYLTVKPFIERRKLWKMTKRKTN